MKSKNYSENIIKVFKKDGFVLSEPDVLLDSDYIIQRSGENFRKLMFTFEDDTGKSMCLRPDLTVASCIKYLILIREWLKEAQKSIPNFLNQIISKNNSMNL